MQKIPLTLGFANMSGDDLEPLLEADFTVLSPLFEWARRVPAHQIPGAQILFVYAHLDENGMLRGMKSSVRQIVQMTKAQVVVLASQNSDASIMAAGKFPGPKSANLVFTNNRNGTGFGLFFRALFEKMLGGKDMLTAWIELSPQGGKPPAWLPGTLLLAEAGKLAFPSKPPLATVR